MSAMGVKKRKMGKALVVLSVSPEAHLNYALEPLHGHSYVSDDLLFLVICTQQFDVQI